MSGWALLFVVAASGLFAYVVGWSNGSRCGLREGFARGCRRGYAHGLEKQIGVDDFLEILDQADRDARGSDGPPPERPEVTH